MHFIVFPHVSAVEYAHERKDYATITNLHITLDVNEWEYLTVVTNLRFGVYFGFRTYIT
jgi:hypothetical protein